MGKTIFDVLSLDRNKIHWEDYINDLTPIEKVGDMSFKREDYFAPLGYGGINGSKLRQAIFLVNNFTNKDHGILISGASVKSPQLPMSSAVATHFGLDSLHVIGATKESTAINHENVRMATWFGAYFKIIKVGYNPVLQSEVKNIISLKNNNYYYLHYGITTSSDSSDEFISKFHMLGANQVNNVPDDITDIIIPAGSCNSCISVILGILLVRPSSLKNIHLIGISPNKRKFIYDRLNKIGNFLGINTLNFIKDFDDDYFICKPESDALNLFYYDLHATNFTTYQDEVKFDYKGIDFHPTYEGKCFYWLVLNKPELINERSLFWIIGSKPELKNMLFLKSELGEFPTKINLLK